MKKRIWHIDALFGLLMAALVGAAYYFDSPRSPDNAIKPVTTKTPNAEHQLLCLDGGKPIDWRCPDGERL
jgi:hypothetical protein